METFKEEKTMKHGVKIVLIVLAMALTLSGCGDFRQRAADIQTSIEDAEEKAQIAEQAAARNTGKLLNLERRMDELETALEEIQTGLQNSESP